MHKFSPALFFDLEKFPHQALFDPSKPAWEALNQLKSYLESFPLGEIKGEIEEGAFLINPEKIFIDKGAKVEAGAYIRGPCIIGQDCEVRHGAYLRGHVIMGPGSILGHASEAKNAIFLRNAKAAHFAYVGDSIVGNHVNLGAGVKCANLRLDGGIIKVGTAEDRISTGLKKLGALIGDGAQLGCNVVTNPGTLIEKGAMTSPGSILSGIIRTKRD